jgi:hypothetical protein
MKIYSSILIALCFTLFLSVSGCVSVQDDIAALRNKSICCAGYNDMLAWKWDGKSTFHSHLESSAPVYLFEQGKSRFVAVEFTNNMANRNLVIDFENKSIKNQQSVFYPAATFLDKDKKMIAFGDVKMLGVGTFDNLTQARAITLIPEGAKYVIIHSAQTNFGQMGAITVDTGRAASVSHAYIISPSAAIHLKLEP